MVGVQQMQDVQSDVMSFRGSHYDLGIKAAQWIKQTNILKNREKEWKKRKPRFNVDVDETYHIFQMYAPQIWEEIKGMETILELPMEQMVLNFANYRFAPQKESGCTVFLGNDYMVRNYDYHPATYDGRYLLFQPNDGGLAQIGPTSRITGRMDGMNESGLSMGYNFMHRKNPGDGFVCYMIGRLILECCKDVDEAIRFLKELPHRSSFSYIVMDRQLNHAIIEASPRAIDVRYDKTCTNHYKLLTHENRNYTKESKERLHRLLKQTSSDLSKQDAFKIFNDPKYEIYSKQFRSWSGTIHTAMYEPQQLVAWLGLGERQTPARFDFNAWLNGEELTQETITGTIDTPITFAND